MTKPLRHFTVAFVACLVLATAASAGPKKLKSKRTHTRPGTAIGDKEKLTIEITGAEGPQATAALQKSFAANGLQATVHEGKRESKKGNRPLKLMAQVEKTADLSLWSKAVTSAIPANRGQSPALELVMYVPLTKENVQQVVAQLEKVKGVDAKHSTADIKRGTLRVRISGADHVTVEEISSSLKTAGITPHFAKALRTKKG